MGYHSVMGIYYHVLNAHKTVVIGPSGDLNPQPFDREANALPTTPTEPVYNSHHIQLTRRSYRAIEAMEVFLLIYNLNKVRVKPAVVAEWSINNSLQCKNIIKDQVVLTQLLSIFLRARALVKKISFVT